METMTTSTQPSIPSSSPVPRSPASLTPLRTVLRINAGFSALSGVAAVVAARSVGDLLGVGDSSPVDETLVIRLVGAGLLVFAALVAALSTADPDRLVRDVVIVSAADVGWVVATIVAVALGWFSTTGVVVMGLVALVVAAFALEQLWFRRRR